MGIIRVANASESAGLARLATVQNWQGQLRGNKYLHGHKARGSTRATYTKYLTRFNKWLAGKTFTIKRQIKINEDTLKERVSDTRFANVEELLNMFDGDAIPRKSVIRIIKEYMGNGMHDGASTSTMNVMFSAIMSYFEKNECPIGMKYDARNHDTHEMVEDSELTMQDLRRIICHGKLSIVLKSIILTKFQAGLDSSTMADRFNYEAYAQIVRHFKSKNPDSWDLDMCPVPIRLVRMKTTFKYITFFDRDAVSALQEYLNWRTTKYGEFDPNDPIYVNSHGTGVTSEWISEEFKTAAVRAGVQKKIGKRQYKIKSHGMRHLLKTTLKACGCKDYVADFVLGHKPPNTYDRPDMYPDVLRSEYAKGSSKINIISNLESALEGGNQMDTNARLGETEAELARIREKLADALASRDRQAMARNVYETKVESLQKQVDDLVSVFGKAGVPLKPK